MDNLSIYNELKKRVGCENKDTIWDNARLIYEQCYDKKYRNIFSNQQEFAEYLGITKGRISQYKYAYEYFLLYQNRIDLRILSVEQVYTLYRTVGSMLFDFFNWVEKEKKKSLINIGLKETKRLIEEYHNCIFNKNSTIMNKVYNYMLSEQKEQGERIRRLEEEPGNAWNEVKKKAIDTVVGLVAGALATGLIYMIAQNM